MSSQEGKPKGYLAKYGAKVLKNGYQIIPIRRGTKAPPFDDWSKLRADAKQLRAWLDGTAMVKVSGAQKSYDGSRDGLGILTAKNPAADIDVRDDELAQAMQDYIELSYGTAPVRVGFFPKRLLLFRTDTPFRKVQSAGWIDPFSSETDDKGQPLVNKVEILGQGQQFVAYAKHPDTGQPYEWIGVAQPAVNPSDSLPELTEAGAQAICDEFDRMALAAGWTRKASRAVALRSSSGGEIDADDPFAEDSQLVEIEDEELERKLMLVPNPDDHDVWFQVGMALYHQYGGDDRGLELWHQWSVQAHNYDSDALDARWVSFDIEGKGRAPLTARVILKWAKTAEAELVAETLEEVRADLQLAGDLSNLKLVCDRIKHIEFDPLVRTQLTGIVKDRFKAITGQTLTMTVARDMVRYENQERKLSPKWLEGFVYSQFEEVFYSVGDRISLSTKSFNDTFGRKLLTAQEKLEGKSVPEQPPSMVALNLYEIPVVHSRRYMPGEDDLFWMNGIRYVNTYDGRNVPELPEKWTKTDRRNVNLIISHFEHLFSVEKDREVLIDAIAFIVQNPGKRLSWAILMQGTQGDGKTFFFLMFAALLALENVTTIGAQAVEEKFTPWAEGSQVCFVEEIKLHGHSRYDVLNRLKPLITNWMAPIRRMNLDTYMVVNTVSYFLATNFKDALPLDDQDNRYFILFSRFQTKRDLDAFKTKNPTYYTDLHTALAQSAGALRKWFMAREISPTFRHDDRAPDSSAKYEMVDLGKSDEQEGIDEVLAESPRMDLTTVLLSATALGDALSERGYEAPYGQALAKLLLGRGFTRLGRVKIKGEKHTFWSQRPEKFRVGDKGDINGDAVRTWIEEEL